MPNIIEITDFSLPELDAYAHLTEAQLHRGKDIFIAETTKVIEYALNSGCKPVSFLMERRHIEGQAAQLISRCPEAPVYTADSELLEKLTGYRLTRGVLCAMHRPALSDLEAVCKDAHRIAVLEGIADPTNIGAIFRSAAALGIDAVVMNNTCCDPLYRRAVRVSMGTVFQIPWTIADTNGDSIVEVLHKEGFKTAAMALTDNSISIKDPRLSAEPKLAVLLGSEGDGLKAETISQSDYVIKIPMSNNVDSLNVAAASAVAFWELGNN